MGPTGVGKNRVGPLHSRVLVLGKKEAITRIDCGEFQHSHDGLKADWFTSPATWDLMTKKTGSARLSQKNIDLGTRRPAIRLTSFYSMKSRKPNDGALLCYSFRFWTLGRLTLGNGEEVDFSHSVIIMTSNLGEKETQAALMNKGLGLRPDRSRPPRTWWRTSTAFRRRSWSVASSPSSLTGWTVSSCSVSLEQDSLMTYSDISS